MQTWCMFFDTISCNLRMVSTWLNRKGQWKTSFKSVKIPILNSSLQTMQVWLNIHSNILQNMYTMQWLHVSLFGPIYIKKFNSSSQQKSTTTSYIVCHTGCYSRSSHKQIQACKHLIFIGLYVECMLQGIEISWQAPLLTGCQSLRRAHRPICSVIYMS